MPFCPNCGAPAEGRFCAKCGSQVDAGAGSAPAGAAPVMQPEVAAVAVSGALSGLEDNVAGALCYSLLIITGVLFLVLEPYNKRPFVRFHALQSILLFACWVALSIVLWIVLAIFFAILGPLLGGLHLSLLFLPRTVVGLIFFVVWLLCMFKAYNREMYQLPIIGPIAAKQAGGL